MNQLTKEQMRAIDDFCAAVTIGGGGMVIGAIGGETAFMLGWLIILVTAAVGSWIKHRNSQKVRAQ